MKQNSLLVLGLISALGLSHADAAYKYVGGDISLLPTVEGAGAKYKDRDGNAISDLVSYSYDQGMNAMRVRVFVNPDNYNQKDKDPNACQSLDYILPICKRIKAAGHALLLDFHYSDTWADPVKQWTPKDWEQLSDSELYTQIYEYTREVLTTLAANDAAPDFIQPGNEISYGMLWGPYNSNSNNSSLKKVYSDSDTNWDRFSNLLSNAIRACREVCPKAKIIIHSERTPKPALLSGYFDQIRKYRVDYDIIGLSYYPYFHGTTSVLDTALSTLEGRNYGKEIWVVETGSTINWTIGDDDKQFYEPTDAGQNQFATDLLAVLDNHPSVTGLFWWEMEYNAYGSSLEGWYNASLFDNLTGKATSAFYTVASWTSDNEDPGDDDDPEITEWPDFYLLYNAEKDSWSYPGKRFYNNGDGTYTLEDVVISSDTEGSDGWFILTSSPGVSWGEVASYLHGAPSADHDIMGNSGQSTVSSESNYSWQVKGGNYTLNYDHPNATLTMIANGTETSICNIVSLQEGEAIYYNLQGIRIENPSNGLYIKKAGGRTSKVLIRN